MAIKRLLPNAQHFREFQTDPVTGHYYHNTCGETALATALVCSTVKLESLAETIRLMTDITREMMGLHWADSPEGATTALHLHDEAVRRGFTVASPYDQWQDPIPDASLHPWLLQWAGIKPIVLMITQAGYGLTAIDGSHPERGVQGHFICVVGLADEGYVCNDGDNNVITDHLVIYPWAAIHNAHVTGFLMIEMESAPVAVPSGWTDVNGVITAPNKEIVVAGFANHIRNTPWESGDWPLEAEEKGVVIEPFGNPGIGSGSRQFFNKHALGWTPSMGVYEIYIGQEHVAALKAIDALKAQLAAVPPAADPNPALEAQIADLQKQLGDAQQQIAALKQTQVTPKIRAEVDAVEALRTALATS